MSILSEMEELLTLFINIIFECEKIPEILKMGQCTKKRNKTASINL